MTSSQHVSRVQAVTRSVTVGTDLGPLAGPSVRPPRSYDVTVHSPHLRTERALPLGGQGVHRNSSLQGICLFSPVYLRNDFLKRILYLSAGVGARYGQCGMSLVSGT